MDRHFEETWTYSLLETWIKLFWCNFISQTHSLRPTGTHTYTIASDRNLQMVPRYLQVSSYRVFRNTHRTFPIAKYSKSRAAADNDLNWGSLGFGGMARVWSLFSWTCIICKDIHSLTLKRTDTTSGGQRVQPQKMAQSETAAAGAIRALRWSTTTETRELHVYRGAFGKELPTNTITEIWTRTPSSFSQSHPLQSLRNVRLPELYILLS